MSRNNVSEQPCANCKADCCRKGQVFRTPRTKKGARETQRVMALNPGNFQGQRTEHEFVIQLTGDCRALDGNSCRVHNDPSQYPGGCQGLEADDGLCHIILSTNP